MCYHRLYIFSTCGHSLFLPQPLLLCKSASLSSTTNDPPSSSASSTTCEPRAHPYQSLRIHRLCARCEQRRSLLLAEVENSGSEVKFEPWRWKVAYQNPSAEGEAWKRWGDASVDPEEILRRREERRAKSEEIAR